MTIESTPVASTDNAGQPQIGQPGAGNPQPQAANTGQTTAQAQEAARVAAMTPEQKAAAAQAERNAASKEATEAALKRNADGTPVEQAEEVIVPEEWAYEGHPSADAALDLMKEAKLTKVDMQAIFAAAVASKDLSKIDTKLLEQKMGGKTKAAGVLALLTQFHTETTAHNKAVATMVHGVMGGEENWGKVRDWAQAREKTDPTFGKDLNQYRAMIDKGGVQAKLAAEALLKSYNSDPKTKGLGNGSLAQPGVNTQGGADNAPLSRSEYLEAVKKENAKMNPDPRVLNSLSARRAAGRKAERAA